MSAAQAVLEALAPRSTTELEMLHAAMSDQLAAAAVRGERPSEDERLVAAMILETLEIRDPAHPIVREAIAAFEAEMAA